MWMTHRYANNMTGIDQIDTDLPTWRKLPLQPNQNMATFISISATRVSFGYKSDFYRAGEQ